MKKFNRIKVSANFHLDEFIDPHTYFNTDDHGMSSVDCRLFKMAQLLRDLYGKSIYINNWWKYYEFYKDECSIEQMIKDIESDPNLSKWSGIRTDRCNEGASASAHRTGTKGLNKQPYGQAIDVKNNTKAFYKLVIDNIKSFYALGLRRLEDPNITPNWLHMDTLERYTVPNSIRVVGLSEVKEVIKF